MLAYVFWHIPKEGTDPEAYEAKLTSFHETLSVNPPAGFRASTVFRHYALPWAPPSLFVYEDWYLVDDFAAFDMLNDAAIEGSRRHAHDDAAAQSAWGAGGVYKPLDDETRLVGGFSYWLSKPEGMAYDAFYEEVGTTSEKLLWRRQMVLGPAPEFCLIATSRLVGLDATLLDAFESSAHTVYRSGHGAT